MVTDPIADLLTRIRNAGMAKHATVSIPSSTTKLEIVRVLKEEGYIEDFTVTEDPIRPELTVTLKYHGDAHVITGLKRVSKPGQRRYMAVRDLPVVLNGLGVAIVTTSKGVMTGKDAAAAKVGGEHICSVW
jgi:small subunit ribosomal protein S8